MADDLIIAQPELTAAIAAIVKAGGSNDREAELVSTNLVEANLKGHDSHGVGMIPRYIDSLKQGGLNVNQAPKIVLDTGPIVRLDGQAGYGQVIGHDTMTLAIERAKQHGLCAAGLYHSHHIGRIGAWAEMAVSAGLVSMHFVNVVSRPIVAAWGGGDARFGTNPICIGVPRQGKDPIVLDFATSRIAQGKSRVAFNRGKPLEPGMIIDNEGRPTTNPKFTVEPPFGALRTFGEHKGYGLAMIAELLGGALTGGPTQHVPYTGPIRGVYNGMMTIVLDPEKLGTSSHFQTEIDAFTQWVQSGPVAQDFDKVRLAGDPERESKARRQKEGIPVDPTTWGDILTAGEKVGLARGDVEKIAGIGA
ncbi:MAG: malate/lactate/ureidoglycolate dehydrogenase [Hyphomicrobiaceae bacterium]